MQMRFLQFLIFSIYCFLDKHRIRQTTRSNIKCIPPKKVPVNAAITAGKNHQVLFIMTATGMVATTSAAANASGLRRKPVEDQKMAQTSSTRLQIAKKPLKMALNDSKLEVAVAICLTWFFYLFVLKDVGLQAGLGSRFTKKQLKTAKHQSFSA